MDCKRKRLHKAKGLCDSCYQIKLRRLHKDTVKKANVKYWKKNKTNINNMRRTNYQKLEIEQIKTGCREDVRIALSKCLLIKPNKCELCGKKRVLDAHHEDYRFARSLPLPPVKNSGSWYCC